MDLEERVRESFEQLLCRDDLDTIERRARQHRRGRKAVVAVPAVAAVTVVALLLPILFGGTRLPAAAATLRNLANEAARQPDVHLGPGEYMYSRVEGVWNSCTDNVCIPQANVRENWFAADGSGRIVGFVDGRQLFAENLAPGSNSGLPYPDVPQDRAGLLRFIEAKAAGDSDVEYRMFVVVGDLLRQSFYRADLYADTPAWRAALFEVAANLPGVTLLGQVEDESGRSGIAVGYTSGDTRHDLIFDPDTSALLGERDVEVNSGTITNWTTLLTSAPVSQVGAVP